MTQDEREEPEVGLESQADSVRGAHTLPTELPWCPRCSVSFVMMRWFPEVYSSFLTCNDFIYLMAQ